MANTPALTTEVVPVELPTLKTVNGHGMATSLQVAERFRRRHDTVLRAIRNLECTEEFMLRNFAEHGYVDGRGNTQPYYEMTRDGFVMLAMGFTGPQAMAWKESFITAFNQLEQAYIEQLEQKVQDALNVRQAREFLLTVPWDQQRKHRDEGLRLLNLVKSEPDQHRRQHHYVSLQRFNALQGEDTPPLEELAPPTLQLATGPTRQELKEEVETLERLRDLLVNALRGLTAAAMPHLLPETAEEMPPPLRAARTALVMAARQQRGEA